MSENENENLVKTFNKLRDYLDKMDNIREKILPMQRQTIRLCSNVIKHVHRREYGYIPKKIEKAKIQLEKMKSLVNNAPGVFPKDYLQIVKQELGEAVIFYNLITKGKFSTPTDCGIEVIDYAYALCDVVGECRRFALNCIRNEDLDASMKVLDYMDDAYSQLFTLDYPGGLIPGLRKKTDIARILLSKTEGDITVSINILKLNSSLKKFNKEE